jgi:hypothetical protein
MEQIEARTAVTESMKVLPPSSDLSDEIWREYQFWSDGEQITYRIQDPDRLVVGTTTHRVLDKQGVVHCVPNIGRYGCVLRWKVKAGRPAIAF